jgi:hypothetical protein
MASRTTPFDIQSVPGYPEALQVYRIPASRLWQVRIFIDRKYVRKSTGTDDKKLALQFAKTLYDTIRINQRLDISVHTDTFHACAQHLMRRQESLVATRQRDQRIVSEDRRKLTADILPFFGTMGVAAISASTLDDYLAHIGKQRKLSPSTIAKHLVVIRKVLSEAQRRNFLKSLPPFPTVRRKDNPRPYFTLDEYRILRAKAQKLAKEGLSVRGVPLTEEIYDFIVFAMNVFVRPSDLKLLRHRDVEIVSDKRGNATVKYLSIIPPNSKTVVRESVSMPIAAVVYERLTKRQKEADKAKSHDFVFFPQYPNRGYALQTLRRQFELVLEQAGLRKDRMGRNRTIYSLRHSALMYRFLKGDKVDIFTLARNALTSVSQLERFYLSHAASRDKIENLHSFR